MEHVPRALVSNVFFFLFSQRKRNLPRTSYVELVLVVDNLRVGVSVHLSVCVYILFPMSCSDIPRCNVSPSVIFFLNPQYKFKKENETAVQEEMVEMANLLDGVSVHLKKR